MELTELERAWQGLDERLAGLERHARAEREYRVLDGVRGRLRWIGLFQTLQLLVGLAIVLVVAPWWVERWGSWHLVAYGVVVHAYGLSLLIVALLQLFVVGWLDFRKPVATVQKRLLLLRRIRLWGERWLLPVAFFAWMPATFALLASMGMDIWLSHPGTVVTNAAVAVVLAGAAAWYTFGPRFRGHFERDAIGGSLAAAQAELDALAKDGG